MPKGSLGQFGRLFNDARVLIIEEKLIEQDKIENKDNSGEILETINILRIDGF